MRRSANYTYRAALSLSMLFFFLLWAGSNIVATGNRGDAFNNVFKIEITKKDKKAVTNTQSYYKFYTDKSSEIRNYSGLVYDDSTKSITEVFLPGPSAVNIRIIPVDATNSFNSLNLLERFLFTEHGIRQKNEQHIESVGEAQIAQIAFISHPHGEINNEVFFGIKFKDKGIIITSNFTSNMEVTNLLTAKDNTVILEIRRIINTLDIEAKDHKQIVYRKLVDDKEINPILIDINKNFNSNFESTF